MRILVAIITCHKNAARIAGQRKAWLHLLKGADYRYFFGRGANRTPGRDEVFLDCGDDYMSLPEKVRAVCRWAFATRYDFLFKIDDDTFVWPDRLLSSDFAAYDYTGYSGGGYPLREEYASGGSYWLSRKALSLVAAANLTDDWAEDRWVGRTLYSHGITVHRDMRYAQNATRKNLASRELISMNPYDYGWLKG